LVHFLSLFAIFLLISVLHLWFSSGVLYNNQSLKIGINDTGVTLSPTSSLNSPANQSKIKIVASFYPIYEFTKKVGGDKVDVTTLIPIGVEPHDFEPTIQQIQNAESANLVIYNGVGLEKWIDKINSKFKVDASLGLSPITSNDTETTGTYDPHVWLDPVLAKEEVVNIEDALVKIDPANSKYYQANANKFLGELSNLDTRVRTELATCNKKDFIAFHNAFTYFASRYGLKQHSVHGVSPEGEILPQKIQQIVQLARDLGLNTIFSEDLVDPRSAEVISEEIPNGRVLILSPIEGINDTEQKAGIGYLDKMNEDINNLKIGLQCQLK
jgi:zinc transport system substrate-binding protein